MEKLAGLIAFVKKNQFWIICGSVSVVMLVSSVLLTSALTKSRKARETELNGQISKIQGVRSVSVETDDGQVKVHPNPSSLDGMNSRIKEAASEVLKAWTARYEKQKPLFAWPEHIIGDEQTSEALKKQPIPERIKSEAPKTAKSDDKNKASDDPTQEIVLTEAEMRTRDLNDTTLRIYGKTIRKRMPELAKIIGANWRYAENDEKSDEAGTEDSGGVKIDSEIVKWRSDDQARWYSRVTEFMGRDDNQNTIQNQPTMMQALYLQQDLWMLEALFKNIKEVNGDADANDLADIKKIDHIYFGRDAIGFMGKLETPNASLANPKAVKEDKKKRRRSNKKSNKKEFDPRASKDPCHGRYVNNAFEPLSADSVRNAVSANELIDNAALTVAKRVPLRIGLIMDERKIPKFLAACANSDFRFEIRQVRINRHKPGETSGTFSANSSSGLGGMGSSKLNQLSQKSAENEEEQGEQDSGENQMPSMRQQGGGKMGGQRPGAGGGVRKTVANRTDFNVKVEFYGIVKIYNPVNETLFASKADDKKDQQTQQP